MIYPPLSNDEFSKRVKFSDKFHNFFTTDAIYHTLKVKSKVTIRFNKIDEKLIVDGILRVYDKNGNQTDNALGVILYKKKCFDFFCIFKKKGTYKVSIFADYKEKKEKFIWSIFILKMRRIFRIPKLRHLIYPYFMVVI